MSKKSALKKNFLTVILLALAGSIIYGLPYYRFYYYDSYMQLYHLSNVQIGMLGSAYGFLGMLSYLLGGVMADKFNAKKIGCFLSDLQQDPADFYIFLQDSFMYC